MIPESFDNLLDAYFDEALTARQRAELEYLIISSPEARLHFWERARFHGLLRRAGTEGLGKQLAADYGPKGALVELATTGPTGRGSGPYRVRSLWGATTVVAAGLVVALATAAWWVRPVAPQPVDGPALRVESGPASPYGLAELVRTVDVEWSEAGDRPGQGSVLSAGWLRFERGLVELQFYCGARIVLEGPAEFELISDMEARCQRGKLSAVVPPPASGFKILTPNAAVVDRGTEFGMQVHADGRAEVHVFQGKVETTSREAVAANELLAGQSALIDASGQLQPIAADRTDFISAGNVASRAQQDMLRRYQLWQTHIGRIARQPDVMLCYDFKDAAGSHVLTNRAPGATPESSGTLVGCQWTEGRWPGKQALEFKQFGDRVRFSLAESVESLSCAAWIRLDGIDRKYNALLMSDAGLVGEWRWQFQEPGCLIFGQRARAGIGPDKMGYAATPPLLGPQQMGLWLHIALVYDKSAKAVGQFLNGKQVSEQPWPASIPLRLNSMEIGNWTRNPQKPFDSEESHIRTFNGRIDEFLLLSRPLSAEEILQMHEVGKPL